MHPMNATQAPLTYDDLIDLHFLLEADELFLQLLGADVKVRGPMKTERPELFNACP
jgi:hypothetical protein